MRARFGWGVTLAALTLAHGAHADLDDGSLNARERRAVVASGLPAASVVYVRSDLVVAIRGRGTPRPGGLIEGVVLQGEVISDEAERMIGYRSMRSTVNVDCARRRDIVVKMTVFAEPQAKGVAINRHVPGGWVQPSPDAYLAQVIRAVCGPAPQLAASPPPEAVRPAPKVSPAKTAPLKPAKPAKGAAAKVAKPTLPPAPAGPPVPSEEAPMPTAVEARLTRSTSPSAAMAADPAPTVAPSVEMASRPALALRPLTPSAVREATARPAAAPAPRPKTAGKIAVQIAAAASERQAREALAKIKGKVTPPLSSDVRSVVVDGKTFHRALVTGFQTRAEAQAFCNGLKGDCFVR
ncbi:SPOR domain-containing protein [Phenylobacterium sp.]|uniref:SPOR domain-containing protein n=1 Tax=Phenylobacterium sp. TaxID=1871053 RepID=UPI002600B95C|nr:SPOR domain-containing protein [Phenylobacterium sp.]